jgi:hypothetical protein
MHARFALHPVASLMRSAVAMRRFSLVIAFVLVAPLPRP